MLGRHDMVRLALLASLLLAGWMPLVAQQTGLTSSDCKAYFLRELPTKRPPSQLECGHKAHRDWNQIAIAATHTDLETLKQGPSQEELHDVEVLFQHDMVAEEPRELVDYLDGPNHWVLFSHVGAGNHSQKGAPTPTMTISDIFNRLVMMANAELVVLSFQDDMRYISKDMLEGAVQMFAANPNLGMLGSHSGYTMGGWIPASSKLQYVAAVELGPIVIRRSLYMEVGMLDCMEKRCIQQAFHSLSLRVLLSGHRIGLMAFPDSRGETPAHVVPPPKHPLTLCDQTGVEGLLQKAVLKYSKLFKPRESEAKLDTSVGITTHVDTPTNVSTYCYPEASCTDRLQTGILFQYFKRPSEMASVLGGLWRTLYRDDATNLDRVEVMVNDDSRSDYESLSWKLRWFARAWLIYAPDTHEIRAYNRMAKLSTARFLVFAQDDDAPSTTHGGVAWHAQAQDLFREFPKLGFLGAHRGRLDNGYLVDGRTNQISGPKFGTAPDTGRTIKYKGINYFSPQGQIPFMFVYKVNAGPLFAHRQRFLRSGMFHTEMSCPGEPGIGFDFEYSIRTWSLGMQVGLYSANWTGHVGDANESGTRGNKEAWTIRRRMEMRNNGLMYEMFPEFHHIKGNKLAQRALHTLDKGKGAFSKGRDEQEEATIIFLRSMQFSNYCDELGYGDMMNATLGTCCKELIVPQPPDAHGIKHTASDYQCVQNPRNWSSMEEAMRTFLQRMDYWTDEMASFTHLHKYINGSVMNSTPEWQRYLEKVKRSGFIDLNERKSTDRKTARSARKKTSRRLRSRKTQLRRTAREDLR
mmetsp:Transcript_2167/g.5504  ORF Transcript_2167/g.5504 Transcript_2167/m.5504 type:complete len:805 (-) Transcript_2167:24-2438(-)